jgi:hypothetical protein
MSGKPQPTGRQSIPEWKGEAVSIAVIRSDAEFALAKVLNSKLYKSGCQGQMEVLKITAPRVVREIFVVFFPNIWGELLRDNRRTAVCPNDWAKLLVHRNDIPGDNWMKDHNDIGWMGSVEDTDWPSPRVRVTIYLEERQNRVQTVSTKQTRYIHPAIWEDGTPKDVILTQQMTFSTPKAGGAARSSGRVHDQSRHAILQVPKGFTLVFDVKCNTAKKEEASDLLEKLYRGYDARLGTCDRSQILQYGNGIPEVCTKDMLDRAIPPKKIQTVTGRRTKLTHHQKIEFLQYLVEIEFFTEEEVESYKNCFDAKGKLIPGKPEPKPLVLRWANWGVLLNVQERITFLEAFKEHGTNWDEVAKCTGLSKQRNRNIYKNSHRDNYEPSKDLQMWKLNFNEDTARYPSQYKVWISNGKPENFIATKVQRVNYTHQENQAFLRVARPYLALGSIKQRIPEREYSRMEQEMHKEGIVRSRHQIVDKMSNEKKRILEQDLVF